MSFSNKLCQFSSDDLVQDVSGFLQIIRSGGQDLLKDLIYDRRTKDSLLELNRDFPNIISYVNNINHYFNNKNILFDIYYVLRHITVNPQKHNV